MSKRWVVLIVLIAAAPTLVGRGVAEPAEVTIRVDAGRVMNGVTPWMYGSCIEDVNHEIYGGIYSQMIFGESFQEPAPQSPVKGFRAYDGRWTVEVRRS